MDIFLSIVAFCCVLTGIAGCIVPVLPGPAIGFAGLLCAWGCSYSTLTAGDIALWGAVTVAVSVADYLLPGYLARRFGGSRSGAVGATVGMIAGFLLFNLPGVIFGPFVGAVAGELLHDRDNTERALRVGVGSFLSFAVGTGLKLIASVGMLIVLAGDTYPVIRAWFSTIF